MVKSAILDANNQFSLQYYSNGPHLTEKLAVETDYLPYINFNGMIRVVCYCYAKQMTKSATFRYK